MLQSTLQSLRKAAPSLRYSRLVRPSRVQLSRTISQQVHFRISARLGLRHFSEQPQEQQKDKKSGKPDEEGGFWGWYKRVLERHPLATKMITSALMVGAGDIFCQFMIEDKRADSFDL